MGPINELADRYLFLGSFGAALLVGGEELAEFAVRRSLELRPAYVPAQVTQALSYLWAGRLEAAREVLAAIRPGTPLHRDAVRVAARCASRRAARQFRPRAKRSVAPAEPCREGLVLDDVNSLRQTTEQLLSEPAPQHGTPSG